MEKSNILFLLDAYALIYRAYYAFISNPVKNSKGFNTSTVFGFVNTIDEVIKNKKPDYIGIAFDPPTPTFRNQIYPDYKANRDETPENIRESIPIIKEIIDAYNIPVFQADGFEADDVIGTLAKKAEGDGLKVFMMTPDKDYGQLVSENISVIKPKKGGAEAVVITVEDICREFMVSDPAQLIEIFALWGDTSDNIPGVPGIGEKTARQLISQFGNIENLYQNIDQLKGKLKENLIKFKEQAYLSRKLVTINTNVPIAFNMKELKYSNPNTDKLLKLFTELEFRSLIRKYSTSPDQVTDQPRQGTLFDVKNNEISYITSNNTIKTLSKEYKILDNENDINNFIERVEKAGFFCFDTETTSLNPNEAELVGVAFSPEPHKAFYLPVPPGKKEASVILNPFTGIFKNEHIKKTGQNLKFDIKILNNYDVEINGELFDTMIAHYLIQPEQRHNLDDMALTYLNYSTVKIEQLIGPKGKHQGTMRDVPIELIRDYACEDADVTLQLYEIFSKKIIENNLHNLSSVVEMPLIYVLADMEHNGVKLNNTALNDYAKELNEAILISEKKIYQLAGLQFNISSPKQLGDILFKRLKVSSNGKLTKTQQFSTSEETLVKLADKHEIINEVLTFRSLKKLLSTYVEVLPKLIDPVTGKIHTSYNQTVTSTGRLSSNNPNLQNIPIRDERGREIRKAFVPSDDDSVLLSADYSQIELRLMAHMCRDTNMMNAFINKEDIHIATAAKIYNVPLENVTREMRTNAKTANFGIIYGISAFGLSQRLNISRTDARELIEGYFRSYPDVKTYMEESVQKARNDGFVSTIMGRRRYLNDINSRNSLIRGMAERNAINTPIQGSAADIIKLAMINIYKEFKKRKLESKMILQVHDELVFDVKNTELNEVTELVRDKMENAVMLNVPLIVEIAHGSNWLDAH